MTNEGLVLVESFLLLQTRRHPSSTLFPYTTLFRSRARAPDRPCADRAGARRGRRGTTGRGSSPAAGPRDRKSTRLNSSHSSSSYAVFCLKKKNRGGRLRAARDGGAGRVLAALSAPR